jgi:hypothetical protein
MIRDLSDRSMSIHARIMRSDSPVAVFMKRTMDGEKLFRTCKTSNKDLYYRSMREKDFVMVGVYNHKIRIEHLEEDMRCVMWGR